MKTIAIIPARGGSKRIQKKNIKNFAGHPIIYFPITTALKSGLFDFVFVSTNTAFDLQELKKIMARINNPFFIIFFVFL